MKRPDVELRIDETKMRVVPAKPRTPEKVLEAARILRYWRERNYALEASKFDLRQLIGAALTVSEYLVEAKL
jgi:hypothetical protein